MQDGNDLISSFSNPNYSLNNDDALNSNLPESNTQYYENDDSTTYDSIDDLPPIHNANRDGGGGTKKSRKKYAQIDLASMGIGSSEAMSEGDVSEGMVTPDSAIASPADKIDDDDDKSSYSETKPGGFLGYYASLEQSAKDSAHNSKKEEKKDDEQKTTHSKPLDMKEIINSPDSGIQNDIQHVKGPVTEDLYAVVNKSTTADQQYEKGPINEDLYAVVNKPSKADQPNDTEEEVKPESEEPFEVLPPGWEKHNDESGPYYWHIKSGTIQREAPPHPIADTYSRQSSTETEEAEPVNETKPLLQEFEDHALKFASESLKNMTERNAEGSEEAQSLQSEASSGGDAPDSDRSGAVRFAVCSLGWTRIEEEDLTPERSSKAVNKCIVDLSHGKNDINDVVGRWGDGKDLYMDIDDKNLSLIDTQDNSLLNVQSIRSIRVWGVGRDNGRDFAYVARDRSTRKHMCHVFRGDNSARQIANTLRTICKKIMMEEKLQQSLQAKTADVVKRMARPTDLPNLVKDGSEASGGLAEKMSHPSFPTPMEEPKKIIRCHYLGTAHVSKPKSQKGSVDTLNAAMEKMYARVPAEKWIFTCVGVAPSTITISEHGKPDNVLAECRVRFLAFMGIAMRNVKLCSFIMHTAQDQFVAHVFHCEPSGGAFCKTIEAACKLRYQKCLDSHHVQQRQKSKNEAGGGASSSQSPSSSPTTATTSPGAKLASSLKTGMQSMFGMMKKKSSS